jgi:hypothetical protein
MRFLVLASLAAALLITGGCAATAPPGALPQTPRQAATARRPASTAPVAYGTYEWSVADFMQRFKAGTLWQFLKKKHVNGVLLGFDDTYIERCSTAKGAAAMNAVISEASRHGVNVELLLGDPSWIPPSGIASLTHILHELRAVHFSAVDLDLEPNQLAGPTTAAVFKELVASMHAYVEASPWPVSIDVNHIYADDAANEKYGYCLMCGLSQAGVKHVNLMTYVSDPLKVVSDVAPILARYPSVTFTISQSVENLSVLPWYDSYWSVGFAQFRRDMQDLDAALRPSKNYGGLLIESMYYLERMKP